MKAIHLKKRRNADGEEYISAADVLEVLDENRPSTQEALGFLSLVEAELNYHITRDLTSYGAPTLERYIGRVEGYCMAKGWDYEETASEVHILSGKRVLFVIEKPAIDKDVKEKGQD